MAENVGTTGVDLAQVDQIFAEWDRADSPGCALGVLQGGELVYARGYGSANLDLDVPLSPDSVLHVASVSKQFTAISIALLASEGKLSLEDDIRTIRSGDAGLRTHDPVASPDPSHQRAA